MKSLILSALLSFSPAPAVFADEPPAEVALPNSVWMDDYTSPELAWAVFHGAQVAIVPVGGSEQNGPHLTLRKHNVIIAAAAEQIARALGQTLIAPLIPIAPQSPLGEKNSNMAFSGTLSVNQDHFEAFVEDEVRSLHAHGFRLICLIPEHSGAIPPLRHLAEKLSNEWAKENTRVLYVSGYHDVQDKQQVEYLAKHGVPKDKQGTHAGVADTSEAWAVYPAAIRTDKLADYSNQEFSQHGATGDTKLASAKLGQGLLSIKIAAAVGQITSAWKHLVEKDQRQAAIPLEKK